MYIILSVVAKTPGLIC